MDFSLTLFELVLMRAHAGTESAYSVVEDGDPDPQAEKRGNIAWVTRFPCVCLGLPGQVNKFDSNRSSLTDIETA